MSKYTNEEIGKMDLDDIARKGVKGQNYVLI